MTTNASVTASKTDDYADVLPLLALKVAPRQFDVNYRFTSVSIRDQMVRAQMLVKTLKDTGALDDNPTSGMRKGSNGRVDLLICGAGPAGIAAATEAQRLGISFVLLDRGKSFPSGVLNTAAVRYVSTAMYEWPHSVHDRHEFPLQTPMLLGNNYGTLPALNLSIKRPLTIREFCMALKKRIGPKLNKWTSNFDPVTGALTGNAYIPNACLDSPSKKRLRSMLKSRHSMNGQSNPSIQLPLLAFANLSAPAQGAPTAKHTGVKDKGSPTKQFYERIGPYQFAYIIYAAGFGSESKKYAKDKWARSHAFVGFWEKDSVQDPWLGFPPGVKPSVVILGSGDGALQDALRCLVDPNKARHPLDIWHRLMVDPFGRDLNRSRHVQIALREIAACDAYTTSGAIWTADKHIYESLDRRFREIAREFAGHHGARLRSAFRLLLRPDVSTVTIVTLKGYFTKAYALNRFLILLFDELFRRDVHSFPQLSIASGEVDRFTVSRTNKRGGVVKLLDETRIKGDLVIIRGGLESRGQLIGIKAHDTARAELGRIPPPIRPIG